MLHSPLRTLLAAVCFASTLGGLVFCGSATHAAPPSDALFPAETKGYVSIPDVQLLADRFKETQLGRLLEDPSMKPFGDDIRRQIKQKWTQSHAKLGLSLEDLEGIATGELSLALVAVPNSRAALGVLVDVSGKEDEAQKTLAKVEGELQKQGARRTEKSVSGIKLAVLETAPKGDQKDPARAVYFLKDGLLGASDNLTVASEIAQRLAGGKSADKDLAGLEAYKAIVERCQSDKTEVDAPHVRWFIDPIGFAEATRTWQDRRHRGDTDYLKVVKNQGFQAIKGVGGMVSFSAGPYGVLHRTAAYAPQPFELAMRMMVFPNGGDFTPQAWVSSDLTTYASFRCDLLNAFDRFDTLFDEVFGEPGVWQDTLDSIKEDPNGAHPDIRNDLVVNLGQRVTIVTDYVLPVTPSSERRLIAIEANNPQGLIAGIQKTMKGDPRVKEHKIGEHIVWEILPEDESTLELDVQGAGAEKGQDSAGETPDVAAAQAVDGGKTPNSAVTVAKGHLFVASDIKLLEKVLADNDPKDQLAEWSDYRLVQAEFGKLGANETCAQGFSKTDEQYRATYELFRAGKLPEADTFFAKFLNLLLGEEKEGVTRKPRLDGSKLPPYEHIRQFLGPAGSFVTSEPNGWYITGFTLGKQVPLANGLSPTKTTKQ
ncbi:MAG TPA: hypothetical protein VHB99_15325 [Pirellulales bacterium]|nr:hypothetical protein [Pirellulales bacterium]